MNGGVSFGTAGLHFTLEGLGSALPPFSSQSAAAGKHQAYKIDAACHQADTAKQTTTIAFPPVWEGGGAS